MENPSLGDSDPATQRLERSRGGDEAAWGELLMDAQPRLLRMIQLRLDPRLRGRLDAADVLQEAFVEATQRRDEYFEIPSMPLFVWLRLVAVQKLAQLHRRHLDVKARDAARDVSLFAPAPAATSAILAARLLGQTTTPSQHAARDEMEQRLRQSLDSMEEADREIIALRNFEQLSNAEAAGVLGIGPSTASSRYIRALKKLKRILSEISGFDEFGTGRES